MAKRRTLSADAVEALHELGRITAGRPYLPEHAVLCQCGLIEVNAGRFGAYTRITKSGREHLTKLKLTPPEATAGARKRAPAPAPSGTLRGAAPRTRRVAAK